MSHDMFYAGLAGGRADIIDALDRDVATLEANYLEWKKYAKQQEALVKDLEKAVDAWREEALDNGSRTAAASELIKELTGKTGTEYFGEERVEELIRAKRPLVEKSYGIIDQ